VVKTTVENCPDPIGIVWVIVASETTMTGKPDAIGVPPDSVIVKAGGAVGFEDPGKAAAPDPVTGTDTTTGEPPARVRVNRLGAGAPYPPGSPVGEGTGLTGTVTTTGEPEATVKVRTVALRLPPREWEGAVAGTVTTTGDPEPRVTV